MAKVVIDGQMPVALERSILQRAGEHAFTIAFLLTSAVATLGWVFALSEGAMAVANWLLF